MEDRQDDAISHWVQELVGVPARGKRSGFRLAIAHHARNDQVRIVKRGAVGMRDGVAELAALVDRAGRFRRDMARHSAREGELREEILQALFIA
jgi:hypothetical protein